MLDTPQIDDAFKAQQDERDWKVSVKRRDALSTVTYPVQSARRGGLARQPRVGALNWRDIRPVMSHRYHICRRRRTPPSWPTASSSAPSCRGRSRAIPARCKVPFFHYNDDFDEVIFYHAGSFFSRDNIHPGMMTLHPSGFTHGPHPKALQPPAPKRRQDR